MKTTARARFAITSWDEKPYSEGPDLPKLTRATVTRTFTGDIEGDGHVEYLMMYRSDGSATFLGLGRKAGPYVLQTTVTFASGQANETYAVIAGSGTGELNGLVGEGTSSVGHGMEHPFDLQFQLPD